MLSSLVVDSRIFEGMLLTLMVGCVAVFLGRRPAFISFVNLGLLFGIGCLCRAPMTCIWLGVFGANALLFGLTCDMQMRDDGIPLSEGWTPWLHRSKTFLNALGFVIGVIPLYTLQNIGAQQIIRVGTVSPIGSSRKIAVAMDNEPSYLMRFLIALGMLGLLGGFLNLQSHRR